MHQITEVYSTVHCFMCSVSMAYGLPDIIECLTHTAVHHLGAIHLYCKSTHFFGVLVCSAHWLLMDP